MLLWGAAAAAAPEASLHGDVKTFVLIADSRPWIAPPEIPEPLLPLLPDGFDPEALLAASGFGSDPSMQGIADVRLKGVFRSGPVRVEVHHAVSALPGGGLSLGGASSGVGLQAPQLLPLTWQPDVGDALIVRGRTDRLSVRLSNPGASLTIGRQPITFGTGLAFTPMDVVNPFSPATIDTEYKPGVDALRFDVYPTFASAGTVVLAYAGSLPVTDPDLERVGVQDVILAATGQGTLGVTDVLGLVGLVRGDRVLGLGTVSALGPIGIHADAVVTWPDAGATEETPFVRAVVGGEGRPTGDTTVAIEAYVQSFGAADPADYLEALDNPRVGRGEVWLFGRTYASLAVAQQITPLISAQVALIGNLEDASGLLAPGLSWSVSDEAVIGLGGFIGLGKGPTSVPLGFDATSFAILPPDPVALAQSVQSEFGLYPVALFLQTRAYF